MAVPRFESLNADLRNAVRDYINLNRHKFNENGTFDPAANPRDHVPIQLVKYRPGSSGEVATNSANAQDPQEETELSRTLSKAGACAIEALPEAAAAASLLGLGAPILQKPFVTKGSAPRTSIASKYMAPLIPGEFPARVWTPRPGNMKVLTKSIGRAVARWIPGLGWALLAHDAYRFGDCMLRDEGEHSPNI